MKRPGRRDNARHEAAHALVAWLGGIPLEVCEIRTHPVTADQKRFVSLGFTRVTDAETRKIDGILYAQDELTEEERLDLRRHLLFSVAGVVAEQVTGTTSQETTGNDRHNAMLAAGRLSGGRMVGDRVTGRMDVPSERKPAFFQVLSDAETEVKKLLDEYTGAWDELTGRILFDGAMTGEQIDRFLTGCLGRRRL